MFELESLPSTSTSHITTNDSEQKYTNLGSPSSHAYNVMQDANNHYDTELEEPNSYWTNRNYNQRIPSHRGCQQNNYPSKFNNQLKHNTSSTTPK